MPARAVIAVAVLVVAFAALTAAHPAAAPRRAALRPAEAIFAFSARARASDTSQVFVVLAGGRVRQLTHEPGDVELRGWTADGAWLIGREHGSGLADHVVAIDPHTGASRTLDNSHRSVTDVVPAPAGDGVAFVGDGSLHVIGSHGADEVAASPVASAPLGRVARLGPSLSWSSNGSAFAYSSRIEDGAHIVAADGRRPAVVNVTRAPRSCRLRAAARRCPADGEPAWRPSSSLIAFVRTDGSHSSLRWADIRTHVDGRYPLPGPAGMNVHAPQWSPDGRRLAFLSAGGVYMMDATASSVVRVLAARPLAPPSWSPDSSRLAYVTERFDGSPDVITVRGLAGGPTFQLPSPSPLYGAVTGPVVWRPL